MVKLLIFCNAVFPFLICTSFAPATTEYPPAVDMVEPLPAPLTAESTYAFVAHYRFCVGAPERTSAPVIVPPDS